MLNNHKRKEVYSFTLCKRQREIPHFELKQSGETMFGIKELDSVIHNSAAACHLLVATD